MLRSKSCTVFNKCYCITLQSAVPCYAIEIFTLMFCTAAIVIVLPSLVSLLHCTCNCTALHISVFYNTLFYCNTLHVHGFPQFCYHYSVNLSTPHLHTAVHQGPTVSQQRIQPILRITQTFIVALLSRYSYVQEYVTVEIFCLALLYFQYPVTGEQSTSSIRSVFAKPNHQWTMCTLLSYSYTL